LYLYFVEVVRLGILEKQIKSASSGLDPLLVLEHHIAQSKHLGVLGNAILHPALGELRMTLKRDLGEGLVFHSLRISTTSDQAVRS
jgi:hypothetical protein